MFRIVLTGGPCAGKTTILSVLTQTLEERGYTCLICEEAASSVIMGGIKPYRNGMTMNEFQQFVLDKQLDNEKIFENAIPYFDKDKLIIIYDRGLCDQMAYVSREYFQKLLSEKGMTISQAENRYDLVVHLVTAANGAVEHYEWNDPSKVETGNNAARYETPEEAIILDEKTMNAWMGHPHLKVVDNSTDFDGKIQRVKEEVFAALGEPIPKEIERKFLIKMPSKKQLDALGCISETNIIQTYLKRNDATVERRIRQRGTKEGGYTFYYTEKRDIGNGERFENEEKLMQSDYISLLMEADTNLRQIAKTRYCFIYQNRHFELDIYSFDSEFAILEIELNDIREKIDLPPLEFIKEVTNDAMYKNNMLAKTQSFPETTHIHWVYETGDEVPEILGSGSQYFNVFTTTDKEEAMRKFKEGHRNYLYRYATIDKKTVREYFDTEESTWIRGW